MKQRFKMNQAYLSYFYDKYAAYGTKAFVEKFNEHFNPEVPLTYNTAKSVAKYNKIAGNYSPPGYYSLVEAAYLLGVSKKNLEARVMSGTLSTKKVGRRHFIREDSFASLFEYYCSKPTLPWPSCTTKEAEKILGVRATSLCHLIKKGTLQAVKVKNKWYLNKEQILWGAKYAKEKKVINIAWNLYKASEKPLESFPVSYECVTSSEAAKLLNLRNRNAVSAAYSRGSIKGVIFKKKLYVKLETVLKLKELREKSGKNVEWNTASKETKEKE